mgnify:CR=1 FL=1
MNGIIKTLCGKMRRKEKPAEFAVIFYQVTHGSRNERTMPGYMLDNGVELVDWLTVRVNGERLHLAIDDYLDMIRGKRTDCRAFKVKGAPPERFTLGDVVAWGHPDKNGVQPMQLFTLHTGRTPTKLPEAATPLVDEAGNMAGWYDKNERRNE